MSAKGSLEEKCERKDEVWEKEVVGCGIVIGIKRAVFFKRTVVPLFNHLFFIKKTFLI